MLDAALHGVGTLDECLQAFQVGHDYADRGCRQQGQPGKAGVRLSGVSRKQGWHQESRQNHRKVRQRPVHAQPMFVRSQAQQVARRH